MPFTRVNVQSLHSFELALSCLCITIATKDYRNAFLSKTLKKHVFSNGSCCKECSFSAGGQKVKNELQINLDCKDK